MKNFKLAVVPFCVSLALSANAFALTAKKPNRCPGLDAIKSAGLMMAQRDDRDGFYVAAQIGNYDTNVKWVFGMILPISDADSTDEALDKAREALPDLSGEPDPVSYQGKWVCMYDELPNGYRALAITPVSMGQLSEVASYRLK